MLILVFKIMALSQWMQGLPTDLKIQLQFNLAGIKVNGIRIAKFKSIEEKEKYVEAENEACRWEYWELRRAITHADGRKAREKLDNARWQFYQKWSNTKTLSEMVG